LSQGRPVVLRHPGAVRPWQHVLDCLSGYLALAEALATRPQQFSGPWNFGPSMDGARPVSSIAETLGSYWKVEPAWVQDEAHHAPEEAKLQLDVSKAAAELGWHCRMSLDEALAHVATWYRDFQRGSAPRDLCRGQIDAYLAR